MRLPSGFGPSNVLPYRCTEQVLTGVGLSVGDAECVRVFGAISAIAWEWIKFLGRAGWHFNPGIV